MIHIDLSDQINWDVCVQSVLKHAKGIGNPKEPDQLTDGQIVFGKDTEHFFADPYGETLHRYLTPIVSRAVGRRLYPSVSFGWIYHNGVEVISHLDRDIGVQWLCSLTIEQDQPWEFRALINDETISKPTKVGRAILIDGSQYNHGKPVYSGNRAINYIFSFTETMEMANLRRRRTKAVNADNHVQYAKEMNLPSVATIPVEKFTLTIPYKSVDRCVYDAYALFDQVPEIVDFANSNKENVHNKFSYGRATNPLTLIQETALPYVEQHVGKKLTLSVPYMLRARKGIENPNDNFYKWEASFVNDYVAIVPCTEGIDRLSIGFPAAHYPLIEEPEEVAVDVSATWFENERECVMFPTCGNQLELTSGFADLAILGYQRID